MIKNTYFNTANWTGRTPRTTEEAFGCYEKLTTNDKPLHTFKTKLLMLIGVIYILFASVVAYNAFN